MDHCWSKGRNFLFSIFVSSSALLDFVGVVFGAAATVPGNFRFFSLYTGEGSQYSWFKISRITSAMIWL